MEFLKNKQDEIKYGPKLGRWESIYSSSAWLEAEEKV